jgi:hypothetical protein
MKHTNTTLYVKESIIFLQSYFAFAKLTLTT